MQEGIVWVLIAFSIHCSGKFKEKIFGVFKSMDVRVPSFLLTYVWLYCYYSGTIPIFTLREQFEIHPSWIDWKQISYFASVENSTVFKTTMDEILKDKEGIQRKNQAVLENMELFDFTTLVPFDTYMYQLQAYLYPDTRKNSSRFGALILPQ